MAHVPQGDTARTDNPQEWKYKHERLQNELQQARQVIKTCTATQTSPATSPEPGQLKSRSRLTLTRGSNRGTSPYLANSVPTISRRQRTSHTFDSRSDERSLHSARTENHKSKSRKFIRTSLTGSREELEMPRYSGGLNMGSLKTVHRRIEEENSRLHGRLQQAQPNMRTQRSIQEQVNYYRQLMLRSGPNRQMYKQKVQQLEQKLPRRSRPSWHEIMQSKMEKLADIQVKGSSDFKAMDKPWR